MNKIFVVVLVSILFVQTALWANSGNFSDKSLVKDSIPIEFFYSNFDKNLDSIMRIWYVQESVGSDLILDLADEGLYSTSNIPDSVFIRRLQKIPSVMNLSYNDVVRGYINVYVNRNRARLEVMLGLTEYYFPIFEEIFDMHGIPLELKYLAVIESALNPRAKSRAGATGLWQFMLGTGRIYKLQVNSLVDERCDVAAATHAAANFMKDLYNVYGDWNLVLAAYNCGPGNVNKAIKRAGGKTSYWEIYPFLPRETRGYVPAYIGATYAMNYYREHNLTPKYVNVPPVSDTIMVYQRLNLAQVGALLNIELQLLRDMNPQYIKDIVPGSSAPCALRLPASYATKFIELQEAVYAYNPEKYLNVVNVVEPAGTTKTKTSTTTTTTATRTTSTTATRTPTTSQSSGSITHKVKSGENLGTIAKKYGVTVSNIQSWNKISGTKIMVGQNLIIYPKSKAPATNTKTTTNSSTTTQKQSASTTSENNVKIHIVKEGESLWKIAQKYNGVTDKDIMKWNGLTASAKIKPGQQLKIIQ